MPGSLKSGLFSVEADVNGPIDEAALVARAVRDRREFAPLYVRYLAPVHRYCHRRLGTREAAEDATSAVFLKALGALDSYRGGSFRAWLFSIAHRVVVDEYRSARPERPIETVADIADPAFAPEEVVLAGEGRRSIHRLLNALPPDQRRVVELRLAGLTSREIADVLGRSHTSVRTTQVRAIARLRVLLAGAREPDGWHDV